LAAGLDGAVHRRFVVVAHGVGSFHFSNSASSASSLSMARILSCDIAGSVMP
jgi:hypothetical protein